MNDSLYKKKILDPIDRGIRRWRLTSNMVLLFSEKYYSNLYELEQDFDTYDLMENEMKFDSNEESMRIFKKTNEDRYEIMKNAFLSKSDKDLPIFKTKYCPDFSIYSNSDNVINLLRESMELEQAKLYDDKSKDEIHKITKESNNWTDKDIIYPMYSPEEMMKLGTSFSETCLFNNLTYPAIGNFPIYPVYDWFYEYKKICLGGDTKAYRNMIPSWKESIKGIYAKMESADDKNIYKQGLIDLGWNPAIRPTEDAFKKVSKRHKLWNSAIGSKLQIFNVDDCSYGKENKNERFYYLGLRCVDFLKNYDYNLFNICVYSNDDIFNLDDNIKLSVNIFVNYRESKIASSFFPKVETKNFEKVFLIRLTKEECYNIMTHYLSIQDSDYCGFQFSINKENMMGIKLFIDNTIIKHTNNPNAKHIIFSTSCTDYSEIISKLDNLENII